MELIGTSRFYVGLFFFRVDAGVNAHGANAAVVLAVSAALDSGRRGGRV